MYLIQSDHILNASFKTFFWALIVMVAASDCTSKFRKIQKNEDWRIKYEAAGTYYEKKDYYRASLLFEDIRPIVRGLPEGEEVEFYLAYCQYNEGTYLLASESFKSFFEVYGRSPKAEEALFMFAYSLYEAAPPSNLDQKSGVEAMNAMQNFLNRYPSSTFSPRAVEVIDASQQKLEEKGFENARQYLRVKNYKAAVIAFGNFQKDFPDSRFQEESAWLRVDAQYQLANKSMPNLQEERFKTVLELYQEFIDSYPESRFLREAERLYGLSMEKLNEIRKFKTS